MAGPAAAVPPLRWPTKVSYGLGTVAFGVGGVMLAGDLLQIYFNQVVGLPAVWVGAAIMASIVIDAVIDPLIGRWSDHTRSPLGRRHIFMYAAALPSALAFWLVWNMPHGLSQSVQLALMVATILFARIATSFYEIPSTALAPELTTDPHERTSLFAWRFFFLIFGGGAFAVVLYQVFLRQDAANPAGMLNPAGYAQFGNLAAVVIFVTIILSTAATHRRIPLLHQPPPGPRTTLRESLGEARQVLGDRELLVIMGAGVLMSLAGGTSTGLGGYFNLHFWGLSPQIIGWVVGLATAAAIIALPAAPIMSRTFGKTRTLVILYLAWLATAVAPPVLRLIGAFPENGDPALFPILCANFLFGVTCLVTGTIIVASMIGDAVQAVAERTGRRSEGLTFAIYGVLNKWSVGAGAFVAGAIVTLTGFPVRAVPGTVDPAIVNNMVYLFLPFATVLNLAAIFLLSRLRERSATGSARAVVGEAA